MASQTRADELQKSLKLVQGPSSPNYTAKSPKTPQSTASLVSQRSTVKAIGSPQTPKIASIRTINQRSTPQWDSSTRIVSKNSPTTSTSSGESAVSFSKATKQSGGTSTTTSKHSSPSRSLPTVSSKNKENRSSVNKSATKKIQPVTLRERQLVQTARKHETPKQATPTKLDLEAIKKVPLLCAVSPSSSQNGAPPRISKRHRKTPKPVTPCQRDTRKDTVNKCLTKRIAIDETKLSSKPATQQLSKASKPVRTSKPEGTFAAVNTSGFRPACQLSGMAASSIDFLAQATLLTAASPPSSSEAFRRSCASQCCCRSDSQEAECGSAAPETKQTGSIKVEASSLVKTVPLRRLQDFSALFDSDSEWE